MYIGRRSRVSGCRVLGYKGVGHRVCVFRGLRLEKYRIWGLGCRLDK